MSRRLSPGAEPSAATTSPTKRQGEVITHLSAKGAFSSDKARSVYGVDSNVAENLAARGAINKRYDAERGAVYWIRAEGEPPTSASALAGFIVILHRNITTPSGRTENFFLARAPYDGKGVTFRKLLRGWMSTLKLKPKDLLGGTWGFELIAADAPVFQGDHLILEAVHE